MLITGIESPCNRWRVGRSGETLVMVRLVGRPSSLLANSRLRDLIRSILFYLGAQGGGLRHLGHAPKDSLLALEGCVGSSSCHLVDREPRWSPHAGVDFWSFVELQPLGIDYDVPGGVAYP
ncbi:hypothetical protein B296_00037536 [Ensete ventricosum]|uniref:Uncharacterized protein n=1 Tax=Ensete ventricosum TaxID=4639 RepID=A0A426X327_ENSVE|nr:hypothetical protein B296_00037536 [Ensete ventricosum]